MSTELSLTTDLIPKLKEGFNILDTRTPTEYLAGTIKNALFVPESIITQHYPLIKASLPFPLNKTILITADSKQNLQPFNILKPSYYIFGDYQLFINAALPTDIPIEINAEEFSLDYKHDKRIEILDIRANENFTNLHLQPALNIPFEEITSVIPELEITTDLYVVGDDLDKILFVTSLLRANGFLRVRPVTSTISEIEQTDVQFVRKKKAK